MIGEATKGKNTGAEASRGTLPRMRILRHGWLGIAAGVFGLAGCSHSPPPAYPDWSKRAQTIVDDAPDPVFTVYRRAALDAEANGAKYLDQVSFTPDKQKAVEKAVAQPVQAIQKVTGKPVDFEFVPRAPFVPAPYQKGWRLIGRSLVWQIQASGDDLDQAISRTIEATSFGFGLTSGGATDASLGLSIADEARRAIAGRLDKMSIAQLNHLATGMEAALSAKPTLQKAIENEHEQMLTAVQTIQDAYVHESYQELRDRLGPDVHDAITYLEDMHSDDARKRPSYFEKFAAEADAEADWLSKACLQPAAKRVLPETSAKSDEPRPWRKFSKQFFRTCRPLLAMNDATLARARMLVLTCLIMADVKKTGTAPKELGDFPARFRQDPYSGLPFVYRADGPDFYLYSVGADFKDDGGETDETYTTPDMLLERAGS